MKLIIDIPEEEYELIVNDEACGLHYLTRAVYNGTPIPDNATNGDVMEIMFSKVNFYVGDWWDKPYHKDGKE